MGVTSKITIDRNSTQYQKGIAAGLIDTSIGPIDAIIISIREILRRTWINKHRINGRQIDVTYLHLREWLNFIRENKISSDNIEVTYKEDITGKCYIVCISKNDR